MTVQEAKPGQVIKCEIGPTLSLTLLRTKNGAVVLDSYEGDSDLFKELPLDRFGRVTYVILDDWNEL